MRSGHRPSSVRQSQDRRRVSREMFCKMK
jgi:hypothetical protein